jgi:DNA-binding NtrC family response regulator
MLYLELVFWGLDSLSCLRVVFYAYGFDCLEGSDKAISTQSFGLGPTDGRARDLTPYCERPARESPKLRVLTSGGKERTTEMDRHRVLVVDDEAVVRQGIQRILEQEGFSVETSSSGYAALQRIQQEEFDLVITDLRMPGMSGVEVLKTVRILQPEVPVIIITGYAAVDSAVEVMKHGAFDYIAKPFTPELITDKVRKAIAQKPVLLEEAFLGKKLHEYPGLEFFVGESKEMQKVYQRILQVAPTDSTVLITGESGTGKELVARAIHKNSQRRSTFFVAVDCTSLAENLLESELFGHVKGSFTGATQTKTGLFRVADGGTLFLDEIGNLSLTTQAKLLRVLQEREVRPIGDTHPIPIDVRLITATNRDLRAMVDDGAFREDLFFRLNIVPVHLPPLRERKGDLPLLVGHFLKKIAGDMGKEIRGLSPDAFALLEEWNFPGNVRELENLIERAVVLARGDLIQREDLELHVPGKEQRCFPEEYIPGNVEQLKEAKRHIRAQAVEPIEKAFVLNALTRNNWNITRAAEETGMLRPNFQALMKKLGISVKDYTDK